MLSPRVPRSVMRVEREELTDEPLVVHEGTLPPALKGHLFVVGPASTADRPKRPYERATSLMNGDGSVARFDFDGGVGKVTTRLLRTPDFLADEAIQAESGFFRHFYRFRSGGILRFGRLGGRNFANTAVTPMKGPGGPRLLITYDAGRPVEIDPKELTVITPVGGRDDWRPEALPSQVFPVVLTPAHPAYDAEREELFTLNYGIGLGVFAETIPIVYRAFVAVPGVLSAALEKTAGVLGFPMAYNRFERRVERTTTAIDRFVERIQDRFVWFAPDTFTDVVRWDGENAPERFRLVLPNGREVKIRQSVHQVAVTRHHVVVLETAFKLGVYSGFNDPFPGSDTLERLLRAVTTRPQIAETVLYVVRRDALDPNARRSSDGVPMVECKRIQIGIEADHFLADYEDSEDEIVVHVAHAPATDLGEWVRPYDVNHYDGTRTPPDGPDSLCGMLAVGAMDVGRFGRYVLHPKASTVADAKVMADDAVTWAIGLYAGPAINTLDPVPDKIEHVFWCCEGVFPELLTEFVHDLYDDYPHRLASHERLASFEDPAPGQKVPSTLIRLDPAGPTIVDRYALPLGVMAGSMQFVAKGAPGDLAGYLLCPLFTDERVELWIFDAEDLARGPLCKTHVERYPMGFCLHAGWLPTLAERTSTYKVPVRDDVGPGLRKLPFWWWRKAKLRELFETHVFPHFEP